MTNEQEINCLNKSPDKLIVHYQEMIRIITKSFIKSGYFRYEEFDDIVQQINQLLLESRLEKIQCNYNGKALLQTYISKVIRNICLEIARKKKADQQNIKKQHDRPGQNTPLNPMEQLAIQDEADNLDKVLQILFDNTRAKTELCLKAFFKIPLTVADIKQYHPGYAKFPYGPLLELQDSHKNKEIYQVLTDFFNQCENKSNSRDAIRIQIDSYVRSIIEILNGKSESSNYSEETLRYLFEIYTKKAPKKVSLSTFFFIYIVNMAILLLTE
jgi:hypothetical protein